MTAPRGLRALVVDDDPTYRRILSRSLQQLGVEEVLTAGAIGIARSKIERGGIDLVTIDVVLGDESGLDLLTWLRSHHPEVVPVLVTAGTVAAACRAVDALLLGAAALILKPLGGDAPALLDTALRDVIAAVDARRGAASGARTAGSALTPVPREVIVIGASTGGPAALLELLRALPPTLKTPILIAQHMPALHIKFFAEQLAERSGRPVAVAPNGEAPQAGSVYLAPGGKHMVLARQLGQLITLHDDGPEEHHCKPAVDPLFRSAARHCGAAVIGAVLTGMGSDGALGAVALRERGAPVAAQDRESSVVWGMPGAVVAHGADLVAPVIEIARWIAALDASHTPRRTA